MSIELIFSPFISKNPPSAVISVPRFPITPFSAKFTPSLPVIYLILQQENFLHISLSTKTFIINKTE